MRSSPSYCFPLSFTLAHSWWVIHHRRRLLSFLWLGWLAGLTGLLAGWLRFWLSGPWTRVPPRLFLSSLFPITRSPSTASSSRFSDLCTRFTPTLEPYQHAVLARQGALSRCWLIGIPAFLSRHIPESASEEEATLVPRKFKPDSCTNFADSRFRLHR